MQELFSHPAFQAGALPFLVALVVAAPLARTRWLGLAQAAGFAACATLVIGWSFESLTSGRRLALVGVATVLLCALVETARLGRAVVVACALVLAGAGVWVLWRLLAQRELADALTAGLLVAGYAGAHAAAMLHVSRDPVRGASAGLALGLGTGVVAVLGASAVLGFAAIAVGAAAGATLLVQMLRGQASPAGSSLSLPAAAVGALAGAAAVMTAELRWYVLLPLLLVAPVTLLVPGTMRPVWLRAVVTTAVAYVPALAAIALAWFRPS